MVSILPLVKSADAPEKHKLIIIGAGAAGIAAATKLLPNGIQDLIILEAEDRLGGRIHNIPYEGDTSVDLGAQWVHGQDGNVVYELAKPFGLIADECDNSSNYYSVNSSGVTFDKEVDMALFDAIDAILDGEEIVVQNGSIGDYVQQRLKLDMANSSLLSQLQFSPTYEQVIEFVGKIQNVNDGSDSWFETSARGASEFYGTEGCFYNLWKKGGYGSFFKLLLNQMPGQTPIDLSKKLLLKKEVTKINWEDPKGVVVTCADGTQYSADRILITVSLGVLKSNLITFVPPLPPKNLNAIKGLAFGTIDKIFIRFPKKWWPEDYQGFHFFWTQQDEQTLFKDMAHVDGKPWVWGIVGFYTDSEDPQTLLGWITGSAARFFETLPIPQAEADTLKLLRHFLGSNYTIPDSVRYLRSTWGTSPHFRGAYSSRGVATERLNTSAKELGSAVVNDARRLVIFFAGEATSEHQYSTVNGAVESGWREAYRILKLEGLLAAVLKKEGAYDKAVDAGLLKTDGAVKEGLAKIDDLVKAADGLVKTGGVLK
ncbi:hypothetical protein M8J76_010176 [Diaphorina citri]|nr:hypothetical protein M8J76_010176 [Diaphorina citri]